MMPLRHCSGVISVIESHALLVGDAGHAGVVDEEVDRAEGGLDLSRPARSTCSGSVRSAMNPCEPPPSSAARSWMRSDVAATATVAPSDRQCLGAREPDAIGAAGPGDQRDLPSSEKSDITRRSGSSSSARHRTRGRTRRCASCRPRALCR